MKIIHVIDTLGFGGAESMLINTIEKSPGIIHYKVFILGKNTPRAEYLSNLGVSVERVTWFNFFLKFTEKNQIYLWDGYLNLL